MKLQQLRYIREVQINNLNVSQTADKLFTSQPGISKQIRLLEEELGLEIFVRSGKQFIDLTPGGKRILDLAEEILSRARDIRKIADDHRNRAAGELSIATTHSQARYALPAIIQKFMGKYPNIRLTIHQGTPSQIAEMASKGLVDLAIATEGAEHFDNLAKLPCYQWNRSVLVPKGHPLADLEPLTLKAIAAYPIVTYTFGFTGRSQLDQAFKSAGIVPQVTLTAADADVIKTYVRLGLGVGIVAHMAHDASTDDDLIPLEAAHLFAPSTTKIAVRRETYLRGFLYDFITMCAPHLTREVVDQALEIRERSDWEQLFGQMTLPVL